MAVQEEAESMPVADKTDSVVMEVEQEEEHVQPSTTQTSMQHTIMCTLIKVAGILLYLWLSTLL